MILKEWIKLVDPIVDVVIWSPDNEDEPTFEGAMFDIPWWLVEYEIGRTDKTDDEEPIYIATNIKPYENKQPVIVINVIPPEKEE